ncbi:amphiphysin-like [Heptranchias perlo]|uniref:amphiphysin-like n=1 Tax=Heptranchias perlo TaxID=212740 RepID=UPI00355A0831
MGNSLSQTIAEAESVNSFKRESDSCLKKRILKHMGSEQEIKEPEVQEPAVSAENESTEGSASVSFAGEPYSAFYVQLYNGNQEEKVAVPSVVVQPASNNESEDDQGLAENEAQVVQEVDQVPGTDVKTPTAPSAPEQTEEMSTAGTGQEASAESDSAPQQQSAPEAEVAMSQSMPPGFMYKVEAVHNFEAANADELNLQRGDIVLVIPSEIKEDQDAGWLTGIRELDWLQYGAANTAKGLFPKNFTQQLE